MLLSLPVVSEECGAEWRGMAWESGTVPFGLAYQKTSSVAGKSLVPRMEFLTELTSHRQLWIAKPSLLLKLDFRLPRASNNFCPENRAALGISNKRSLCGGTGSKSDGRVGGVKREVRVTLKNIKHGRNYSWAVGTEREVTLKAHSCCRMWLLEIHYCYHGHIVWGAVALMEQSQWVLWG